MTTPVSAKTPSRGFVLTVVAALVVHLGLPVTEWSCHAQAQEIPDELLEDEHVREEFGVNKFTTPSIKKIFEDLQKLRPLPYDEFSASSHCHDAYSVESSSSAQKMA